MFAIINFPSKIRHRLYRFVNKSLDVELLIIFKIIKQRNTICKNITLKIVD